MTRPHFIIITSCKPGCEPRFRQGLQPGFRQVSAHFRHAFDQLSTFFCGKPGREPQQVRWFVRVLDKWNAEQELTYRKLIARQLRIQYAEGIYDNPVTLKSRLTVTQDHRKRNH